MEVIVFAKLLAIKEGSYTIYVFKNLDDNSYIMCTKLPNWQSQELTIGDEGFLKIQKVSAGEDYYNPSTETKHTYGYSNIYFLNFILKSDITNLNIIL